MTMKLCYWISKILAGHMQSSIKENTFSKALKYNQWPDVPLQDGTFKFFWFRQTLSSQIRGINCCLLSGLEHYPNHWATTLSWEFTCLHNRDTQMFQKSRSHLKILGSWRVIRQIHMKDPQIHNVVSVVTWDLCMPDVWYSIYKHDYHKTSFFLTYRPVCIMELIHGTASIILYFVLGTLHQQM
jgi:hypothetical protein